MDWFLSLLMNDGIAHTVLIFAFVIALGMSLGKIKIFGVSLGIAFVLFVGLACGHFGLSVNETLLGFIKDFGLILFVFAVGLQVGPSFFSSFKKDGLQFNIVAVSVVCLDIIVTIILYYIFSSHVSIAMMVGILTGATLNIPSLGAAQEAMRQLSMNEPIALGSAVAYPIGIVAAIPPLVFLRIIFKINAENEAKKIENAGSSSEQPMQYSVLLANNAIANRSLEDVKKLVGRDFIISRLKRGEEYFIPQSGEILHLNDSLKILSTSADKEAITVFIGKEIEEDWKPSENKLVSRKIVITQDKINGKTLGSLSLQAAFGISITRVSRSGIDLLASPNLTLQIGDKVSVVGEIQAIQKAEYLLGNTLKRLNEPNIVTIFVGILLGVLLGSIPISLPDMPIPVKLGLAGGPLVVAILLGRFGYKLKLITYTTQSANLMIREMGICLFLASVGIGAGAQFVESITSKSGLLWLFCGFLITMLPLIIVGFVAIKFAKFNFLTLMGVLSGSRTNPPLLVYSNSVAASDAPAVGYSTVYPLTMFLRILSAQVMILVFCG
ncbi:MAG: putative transporter [Fibromonadaceae bacterium]|jgi:putative transport protein|nr:putative transporter [Fibromonadaceae bacterium]